MIETPQEIPVTCGFCYPDLDFDTYIHQACTTHAPDLSGVDDEKAANRGQWLNANLPAGGQSNADMCEMIHQRRPT